MTATLTSPPAGGPPAVPKTRRSRILPSPVTGQELVLLGVIAVIWVGLALATPAFLTAGSIRPLLVATAPIALIGVGMTIIIITGGIDVSVGGAGYVVARAATAILVECRVPAGRSWLVGDACHLVLIDCTEVA